MKDPKSIKNCTFENARVEYNEEYFQRRAYEKGYQVMKTQIVKFVIPLIVDKIEIKKDFKILELGCAFGYLLEELKKFGCEVFGLDVSDYALQIAKRLVDAHLIQCDADTCLGVFRSETFDVVIALHVIEHLKAPYTVLKEIHRILKRNGLLIISTPNVNSMERILYKMFRRECKWHGIKDRTHKYLFTPFTLKFLIQRAGFEILHISAPIIWLDPNQVLNKFIGKLCLGGTIFLFAKKSLQNDQ